MTKMSRPSQDTPYGEQQQRTSNRLLYVLAFLTLLIIIVFAGLHIFGQRFGVPV